MAATQKVSYTDAIQYWSNVPATVDGMLGGYGGPTSRVPRLDIAHSRRFLSSFYPVLPHGQVRDPSQGSLPIRGVDCGAGIGRVSRDLLHEFVDSIDIVEPARPLCEALLSADETATLRNSGRLGSVHVCGVQDFDPRIRPGSKLDQRGYDVLHQWSSDGDAKYTFIWNQWCLGQLDDPALIAYLVRCKEAVAGGDAKVQSLVFVKENVASGTEDIFDDTDSSWTRTEASWDRVFKQAGLKAVRSSWQHGFPKELFRVKLWALQ
ncbi:hypothetical protein PYCC9005_002989 [Savitreella phatthalungensis]